jgi:DNA-binding transcriptional ArsR family regulator
MSPSTILATGAALSDPTRLLVLFVLGGGPLPVGQLAVKVHVTSSSVSYHLRLLQTAGLVGVQRVGRRSVVRRVERRWALLMGAFTDAA